MLHWHPTQSSQTPLQPTHHSTPIPTATESHNSHQTHTHRPFISHRLHHLTAVAIGTVAVHCHSHLDGQLRCIPHKNQLIPNAVFACSPLASESPNACICNGGCSRQEQHLVLFASADLNRIIPPQKFLMGKNGHNLAIRKHSTKADGTDELTTPELGWKLQ